MKKSKKNPVDLSVIGLVKQMEICTKLDRIETENDIEMFVDKWRTNFLNEVKDSFISSNVDDICDILRYFLYVGDESGTSMDPCERFVYNFNIDKETLWFAFYKKQ